jgi:MoxR-like ATPase
MCAVVHSAGRFSSVPGDAFPATVRELAQSILDAVDRVLVGKRSAAELILAALLAEGHVLIEDLPGVGKTTLARALAAAIGGDFKRIQFTPDLLPSDVTGITFFDQRLGDFRFRPGPIFANIVVADEINRATPRTQSALLEAMQERSVSIEGETRTLSRPFLVIATENPIELEGTFPLPEAQIDRFMLRMSLGYPTHDEEDDIVAGTSDDAIDIAPAVSIDDVCAAMDQAHSVFMSEDVTHYLTGIVRSTRTDDAVEMGASPRASQQFGRACKALAAIQGRNEVIPDDVKQLAVPVLGHRIIVSPDSRLRGRDSGIVIRDILERTPVPVEGTIGLERDTG